MSRGPRRPRELREMQCRPIDRATIGPSYPPLHIPYEHIYSSSCSLLFNDGMHMILTTKLVQPVKC